jgi:hypothetical protein
MKTDNDLMMERSGYVQINSRLVSFIYELLRDHLSAGVVEQVVRNSLLPDVKYCNGWLAEYAGDIANRLLENEPQSGLLVPDSSCG